MPFESIEAAAEAFRRGGMVILVDDEARENEGDLAVAAEHATPEAINFMAREGRGLVCVSLEAERLRRLELPLMVPPAENSALFATAFTVSVDARHGVTTGISAADRAATVRVLIDPRSEPGDLARPGHVFPLRAAPGGVLERPGQTEASLDLARIAGLVPAAVICEVMSADGTMARRDELAALGARHGIPMVSVADLVTYRSRRERYVELRAEAGLPTAFGEFRARVYEDTIRGGHHLAFVRPGPRATADAAAGDEAPLVRVHSECLTGDALGSLRCDCGAQLVAAERAVAEAGRGAILYLRQEGRGIGLVNKLRAYELQDRGLDTVEANHHLGFAADARDYGVAAQILGAEGWRRIRLLTNNPSKVEALERLGIEIVERLPLVVAPTEHSGRYLAAKREKLGHLLPLAAAGDAAGGSGG